jgi:hypothetical protein
MVLGEDPLSIGVCRKRLTSASANSGEGCAKTSARSEWRLERKRSTSASPSLIRKRLTSASDLVRKRSTSASDREREPSDTHNKARNVSTISTDTECVIDWSEFQKEPLKSVDLREMKEQRTEEEVNKLYPVSDKI